MNACALGWDNHRKFSKVSVMEQTPDGAIRAVERRRLEHNDKAAMRAWLSHLAPEIPVALEATFGWPWVADLLEELGHPVHLGHLAQKPALNAGRKSGTTLLFTRIHTPGRNACNGQLLHPFPAHQGFFPKTRNTQEHTIFACTGSRSMQLERLQWLAHPRQGT
jgi:hypothetical protein